MASFIPHHRQVLPVSRISVNSHTITGSIPAGIFLRLP